METEGKENSSAASELDFEQTKLDLENWRIKEDINLKRLEIEEDIKLRRDELDLKRSESSKRMWSSPLLIAIVGLFATLLASIIQNSCQSVANRELERQRFESTRDLERQKFEATLIQKALESSSRNDARERFKSYLALGVIKDEPTRIQIEKYVNEPDTIPLQPQSDTPVDGDTFKGTARRDAKLSIGSGSFEMFGDLKDLIASVPSDDAMITSTPPITLSPNSERVNQEQRNVQVRVFLYAAAREESNDFTLIVGRAQGAQPEMYMIMKVSGLPTVDSQVSPQLNAARGTFKSFFGNDLPGFTYDFYDPPIPLDVEGSLLFSMSHATGTRPGPSKLKPHMPTLWEVRPITKIVFESQK